MRSRRGSPLDVLALSLAATGTAWVATLAWRGFTRDPGSYWWPLLLVALVVAFSGAGLRWLRLTAGLVLLGQLFVSAAAVSLVVTGSPLPVGGAGIELLREVGAAVDNAQHYRAPVPPEAPIGVLLVLGGWVCTVLVDFFASTLRRASLAGLPLLLIYSIPVSMLGGGVAWWAFALTAGGFLLTLYLQHGEATTRWGRQLDQSRGAGRSGTIRAGAGTVGAAATVLAVFVPLFVPTMSLSVFGLGPGTGEGDGVSVTNPMTDLRRDLMRTDDVPLLRVRTDDPDPSYLRIAVLNWFTDNEWTTGDRDLPTDNRAVGQIPLTDVDSSVQRTPHDYEVSVLDSFESRWLPTQYPVSRISAEGDWRYDVATRDFLAFDDGLDTAGLSYAFTGVDLGLDAEELADAPSSAGKVDSFYRDLPDDFPAMVSNLAIEITRDASSGYEKAVALQDWFREDGGFTYSLEDVPQGNGPDELVAFLTEGGANGRVGYCEQFASAMAAMARSLGIPARVAVGFLTPEETTPGSYEYSSDDMHSWPELYFSGAGWVRFEPTPPDRASGVPDYTTQDLFEEEREQASQQPSGAAAPSVSPGTNRRLDEGTLPEDQSTATTDGFPLGRVVGGGAVVLAVAALVLLPGVARRRQSARRLTGAPELAWAELEATTVDLGIPWPGHRSPRQVRDRLAAHLGAPATDHPDDDLVRPRRGPAVAPEAAAALARLVLAVERLRYSRAGDGGDPDAVVSDTRTVVASLHDGADPASRRKARWWPASTLPWRRRQAAATAQPVLVRHGSVIDHVG